MLHAQSLQSCLTLCDPKDSGLPGAYVRGILQARILEWVAMSSSRGSSQSKDCMWVSCVSCFAGGFFTTELSGKPTQMLALHIIFVYIIQMSDLLSRHYYYTHIQIGKLEFRAQKRKQLGSELKSLNSKVCAWI